jgi:type VI secretion system secreted protein Hcp
MAIAYLTLKGQKQGNINGGITQKGHENSILVHSFSNEILTSRDPTSGLLTGKRQHNPISILKEIDKSSPPLWAAMVNNENLVSWELQFWTPTAVAPGGAAGGSPEKLVYKIDLTNASIASIREYMSDNTDATKASLPLLEEVTFTYQKIQWTWTDGGLTASDDWSSPVT